MPDKRLQADRPHAGFGLKFKLDFSSDGKLAGVSVDIWCKWGLIGAATALAGSAIWHLIAHG